MSQIVLHDAQIRGLVGQVVAAAVTQHVWVDLGQSGVMSDAGDQIIDGLAGQLKLQSHDDQELCKHGHLMVGGTRGLWGSHQL